MPRMLITGGSRGIGREVARLAHRDGWELILHGRSASPSLTEIGAELDALTVTCDGVDRAAVLSAIADAGVRDGIDSLVNCLGAVTPSNVLEDEDEVWLDQYSVNVLGPLHFCQAVLPGMLAKGRGSIVNVSSIRGYHTMADAEVAAYCAAKAALINVTTAFARKFAPDVRVNAVAPGFTLTDMADTWSPRVRQEVETALLRRAARPEEIAECIYFLASEKSSFVTGQVLLTDGGYELATTP
jgi:NAD(P)-dependent dehydrogenase (short-subunit alcohol dehydrogenase family)